MTFLILGLVLFLGAHSLRIVAEPWRSRVIAQRGEKAWKGLYTVLSLVGFGLVVWGFGQARLHTELLWSPPVWTRHLAALLMMVSFILLTAAYVPGNAIKARVHHPMILSVKVWAAAHLLANGRIEHVLLFGAFLAWAVLDFRACRQRDRAAASVYPAGRTMPTVHTVLIGLLAWAGFAFWAHGLLIGVRPFG